MHAEIRAAGSAHGGCLRRRGLAAFVGPSCRRRRSSRLRRGSRRLGGRRSWWYGSGRRRWRRRCRCRRRRCCGGRCGRRLCGCSGRRSAFRRPRPNGVERRLARRRYLGGIALETFERVPSPRLDAGALRHEVGTAGGADRRNLLGCRLLGSGRQRSPHREPGRKQHAHSAPTAERHAKPPSVPAARCTIGPPPSRMRCIAIVRWLCGCGLVC